MTEEEDVTSDLDETIAPGDLARIAIALMNELDQPAPRAAEVADLSQRYLSATTDESRSTRLRTILRWMNGGSHAEAIQRWLETAITSGDWQTFADEMIGLANDIVDIRVVDRRNAEEAGHPFHGNQWTDEARAERVKAIDQEIQNVSRSIGGNSASAIRERKRKIEPLVKEQNAHLNALNPSRPEAIVANSKLVRQPDNSYHVQHAGEVIGSIHPMTYPGFKQVNGAPQMTTKSAFKAKYGDEIIADRRTRQESLEAIARAHSQKLRGAEVRAAAFDPNEARDTTGQWSDGSAAQPGAPTTESTSHVTASDAQAHAAAIVRHFGASGYTAGTSSSSPNQRTAVLAKVKAKSTHVVAVSHTTESPAAHAVHVTSHTVPHGGSAAQVAAQVQRVQDATAEQQRASTERLAALANGTADDTMGPDTPQGRLFRQLDAALTAANQTLATEKRSLSTAVTHALPSGALNAHASAPKKDGGGGGGKKDPTVKTTAAPTLDAKTRSALTDVIDQMAASERAALDAGFKESGLKSETDFLAQQAALYAFASEGDPRFKTWLSGDTVDRVSAGPAKTGVDAWTKALKPRAAEEAGHPFHGNQYTGGHGGAERTHGVGTHSSKYTPMRPAGLDTKERFSDGHGHYTPERQQLHDEIIAKYMANTTPVEHPTAMILGGGMGAGKTTLVNSEKLAHDNTVEVNVDKIRADLPELREALAAQTKASQGVSVAETHEEASDISRRLMQQATAGGRNLTLDGTGNTTLDKLGGKVAEMRATGHTIVAEYVTVPTAVAQARADERARTTDRRFVPPSAMTAVHAAVSRIFPEAVRQGLFDKARLWDTSGTLGTRPKLIASANGTTLTVHDHEKWQSFLDKGKEG